MNKPQSTRVTNKDENQANLSYIQKAKLDKRKSKLKKAPKTPYGLDLGGNRTNVRLYASKRIRHIRYLELKKQFPGIVKFKNKLF